MPLRVDYLKEAIERVKSGEAGVGGCEAYDADDFLGVCEALLQLTEEGNTEVERLSKALWEIDNEAQRAQSVDADPWTNQVLCGLRMTAQAALDGKGEQHG